MCVLFFGYTNEGRLKAVVIVGETWVQLPSWPQWYTEETANPTPP